MVFILLNSFRYKSIKKDRELMNFKNILSKTNVPADWIGIRYVEEVQNMSYQQRNYP